MGNICIDGKKLTENEKYLKIGIDTASNSII